MHVNIERSGAFPKRYFFLNEAMFSQVIASFTYSFVLVVFKDKSVFLLARVTQPNFDHLLDSTTSIHFIPSKFDPLV